MNYTYVLYSDQFDRIYVGQTSNLRLRFEHHNDGLIRSTKAYKPWRLIHFEEFHTRVPIDDEGKRIEISSRQRFYKRKVFFG